MQRVKALSTCLKEASTFGRLGAINDPSNHRCGLLACGCRAVSLEGKESLKW